MNVKLCGTLLCLALCLCASLPGLANNPGGVPATGTFPNVTLTDNGSTVVLANGTVTATVSKSAATVTSLLYKGYQLVSSVSGSSNVYFSMDGSTSYQNPSNCVYTVKTSTTDMVDVSCKHFYASGDPHILDIDIHYVLRRGASGLYVYAVLTHPATYAATSMGEWRMVWQLPHSSTAFLLENIYVDDLRNGPAPSYYDFTQATVQGIKEISLINTGPQAGTYFCKYQFAADYRTIGAWGHASDVNKIGAWVAIGGDEYLNDGPTKQDLTLAEGYILIHFGRNHYNGSSTTLADGEDWSKTYGPYLLYLNSGTNAAACWADAKAQFAAETGAWPYSWLTTAADYPAEAQRGSVSGKLLVSDPLRPAQTGAGAWVGVSQPDTGGNWQFESKRYQYWTKAGADGSFTIPHVRPGAYVLSAFVNGVVGEYTGSATVSAGATTNLGTFTWTIAHPGQSIAWEIGTPDRDTTEFRHGSTNYWYPFLYTTFYTDFPPDASGLYHIDYTIGVSNPATDWNYAQSALQVADGSLVGWPWNIHFNLPANIPRTGNATLTLAFAGNDGAHLYLFINSTTSHTDIGYPPNGGGNGLLREGGHGKYGLQYVSVPMSKLVPGANTITLLQASTSGSGNHVNYDYVNLEMPYAPLTLSGKIMLPNRANMAVPVTVTLTPSGTTVGSVTTQTLTLAADGSFTLTNVPVGTYTLGIKGAQWLKKDVSISTVAGSTVISTPTLVAGDLNGDNQVAGADLALVRAAYGSVPGMANWNALADLNGDGQVSAADLAMVRASYGKLGDP